MNTRLSLIILGVSGACLGGVTRYRRRQGGAEETLRGQPRFSGTRERDQFIYGHDDEPDFNDDHTDSFSSERFTDVFNLQFSNGYAESPQNENQANSYIPESANENDGFLNSFIESNLNNFSKYEEALPQAEAQAQPQPQSSSKTKQSSSSQEEDTSAGSEPSLREFTLLVSKLLFHLSQM